MHSYMIAFELSAPIGEYMYLLFQLTALHGVQLADGTWRVFTDKTPAELTSTLTDLLRAGDRLRIVSTDDPGSLNSERPF
ncbi:MAG TPA: hypothetical protein VGG72_28040 [Bryobacteraceae bacterium]|jgi:hypothetical protein